MAEITLGGERLGSGNKQKVYLRNYERSTHDLGYIWRSTMSAGTLVPFMTEVALPGDTFDINLDCDIKTHPTIGPLFGSFKVQLDVFQIPIRLYNGQLHMNKLGIGLKMSDVKLSQMTLMASPIKKDRPIDNQQMNPSCIFSYLNIRGVGATTGSQNYVRDFNAIPYLAYWDIYKNYYSNKQEEVGAVIHNEMKVMHPNLITVYLKNAGGVFMPIALDETTFTKMQLKSPDTEVRITFSTLEAYSNVELSRIFLEFKQYREDGDILTIALDELFQNWAWDDSELTITGRNVNPQFMGFSGGYSLIQQQYNFYNWWISGIRINDVPTAEQNVEPQITTFPLENIDLMREEILKKVQQGYAFNINDNDFSITPYSLPFDAFPIEGDILYSRLTSQEGLALKTYQSDLFNNWISTEWIDGDNGVNAITKIDTTDGGFTIDELNLSKKIYDMLNRIAISGGTYDDWLDATYTHERMKSVENPMYMGGLIKELTFQEVVSNAENSQGNEPLGTLAGRGVMTDKNKGGYCKIKVDEPSYIMGIISLTPRIDYSQGNKWDTNLKTMDDFHKPALDEIGFQDLITDQMAWWDTSDIEAGGPYVFKSAGKQPAWINYMTNVNQVRGNFAIDDDQRYMVLDRRYEPVFDNDGFIKIKDLTTYIDPSKFNHIFAYKRRDAQNFWAQIKVDITARRKMSAKVIPNL